MCKYEREKDNNSEGEFISLKTFSLLSQLKIAILTRYVYFITPGEILRVNVYVREIDHQKHKSRSIIRQAV